MSKFLDYIAWAIAVTVAILGGGFFLAVLGIMLYEEPAVGGLFIGFLATAWAVNRIELR